MATKKTQEQVHLTISPPNFEVKTFKCRGTAPFVQHRFSEKSKEKMIADQMAGDKKKSKKKREPRDFDADYKAAMHVSEDGWIGIPASAFRNAMISACRAAGYVMTRAKLALAVVEDGIDAAEGTPLVRITAGEPEKHLSHARNDGGGADIRCRPMWREWEFHLAVRYDADMLSATDVANLLARAGMQVGVGEGRPDSKKSNGLGWGLFEIVND